MSLIILRSLKQYIRSHKNAVDNHHSQKNSRAGYRNDSATPKALTVGKSKKHTGPLKGGL